MPTGERLWLRSLRHLERFTRVGMHHLAVVAVVPGSGTVRWSVGCGAAGVVEVSVFLTSQYSVKIDFQSTVPQKPQDSLPNSHLSSLIQRPDGWLRVHDSRSRTRGCTPTISATTPAVRSGRETEP